MPRKMHRWLCGVMVLTVFVSFSILVTSFCAEIFTDNADENYMGLDGEVSVLPISCSTCALVGQSGYLLKEEYGSEIDEASCVFRLGFSPNRGMQRFVGARTTARIVDSFSFFPFLKRPWKLVTGPFASEAWVLFDRRPGDISWYHRPLLSDLVQKHDSKFFWMTKRAEGEVQQYLRDQTTNIRVQRISGLWFALKVVEDAGCRSLKVYGIPDHQICKRNMKVEISSLYWDNSSVPLCADGVDASFLSGQSLSPVSNLPTVPERKVLLQWTPRHLTSLLFRAPEWPS